MAAVVAGVALALTLVLGMPSASAAPATRHGPGAAGVPAAGVSIRVNSLTPTVAGRDDAPVLTGTIVNAGPQTLAAGRLDLVRGAPSLSDIDRVAAWAESTVPAAGARLASVDHPAVPAGRSVDFTLTLPTIGGLTTAPYDVLPLSLELGDVVTHTFLPVHQNKEYEPLALGWLVPLTIDADPRLWGAPSADRVAAWQSVLGPDSRVSRTLTAFRSPSVGYAVDAALLAPPAITAPSGPGGTPAPPGGTPSPPSATTPATGAEHGPSPTAYPSTAAATPDVAGLAPLAAEEALRSAAAARLRTLLADTAPWVLPSGDPDLAALPSQPLDPAVTTSARAVAASLGGASDIAWPADPAWSSAAGRRYAAQLGLSPTAVVVDRSSLTWEVRQGDAGRKATDGQALVVVSDPLGAAAARAVRPESAGLGRLEFLALTMAQLRETPGIARTALVGVPRDVDPDPSATKALFDAVAQAPWLTQTSPAAVLAQAEQADPASSAASVEAAPIPTSPLADTGLGDLRTTLDRALGAAAIRADKATVGTDWAGRLGALDSIRWRGRAEGFEAVRTAVVTELKASIDAVRVAPQTINFLAASGRLQVVVLNALDVPVEDVRVELVPDNPRLRITTAARAVSIGARSRTTVTYDATALAAGPVRIDAVVTGPTGVSVGPTTTMNVRVSPTGNWIYAVLAALAALALGVGLWRSRRLAASDVDSPPNAIQLDEAGEIVETPSAAGGPEPADDPAPVDVDPGPTEDGR